MNIDGICNVNNLNKAIISNEVSNGYTKFFKNPTAEISAYISNPENNQDKL